MRRNTISAHRQAARALRWYPPTWKARFGDEFVALMEDEILDHPHSLRRTLNVAQKGSVARLADAGLVGRALDPSRQLQAAMATTTLLGILFAAGALKMWSESMLDWNATLSPSTWEVTTTTTVLTVTLGAIALMLIVGFAVTLATALRNAVRRPEKRVLAPLGVLLASAAALWLATHVALRFVIARGGIQWAHPGYAVKQVAGASLITLQEFEWALTSGHGFTTLRNALFALSPLFLIAFGSATTALVRQLTFTPTMHRVGRAAMVAVCLLMATFLGAFALWEIAGGNAPSVFTQGRSFPILAFSLMGALVVCSGSCMIHSKPRLLR